MNGWTKWLWIGHLLWAASSAYAGDPICARRASSLRKGPAESFAISWKVPRYMPVLKLETKGSWYKVEDFEGEIHWAKAQDFTNSISCVVVKAQTATLRREPSTSSPPAEIKVVDRYTPFKKLEKQGQWFMVEDEGGRKSWVSENLVWRPLKVQSFTF